MSRSSRPRTRSSRGPAARARALRALLTTTLGAVLVLAGLAAPATAHGGDVIISLGTDGQGGVSANLTWKIDGHPVEEAADVTVTAESADGETVGPLTLLSASEGVGWYTSEPGVLAEGNWVLTATITTPAEATASAQVDVVPPPVPSPSADDEAAADEQAVGDDEASAAQDQTDASSDGTSSDGASVGAGVWIAVAVVAALLLAGAVVVARRRARSSSTSESRTPTSTSAR